MSNAPLGTVTALLRHASTNLVKRYAHLSPDHLKHAVEMVSVFRQDRKPKNEGELKKETVTGTGTEEKEEVQHDA